MDLDLISHHLKMALQLIIGFGSDLNGGAHQDFYEDLMTFHEEIDDANQHLGGTFSRGEPARDKRFLLGLLGLTAGWVARSLFSSLNNAEMDDIKMNQVIFGFLILDVI
jgi:hypothetical protein